MKTCYVIPEVRAIADLVQPFELTANWTITRINVPRESRGQGYGTRLLEMILADADAEGLTLQLEVQPSGEMTYAALTDWYMKHGFQQRPRNFGYMIRRPKSDL